MCTSNQHFKKFLRLFCYVISIIVIVQSVFLFTSCSIFEEETNGEENTDKIFCTASDFKKIKNKMFGKDSLLSNKALKAQKKNLKKDEEYYLIHSFYVGNSCNGKVMDGYFKFENHSLGKSYVNESAVTIDYANIFVSNPNITITIGEKTDYDFYSIALKFGENGIEGDLEKAYIAIPFTVDQTGILNCSFFIAADEKDYHRMSANVMQNKDDNNDDLTIKLLELDMGLMYEEGYNEQIELHGTPIDYKQEKYLSNGKHYLLLKQSYEAIGNGSGRFSVSVFFHNGCWENLEIEVSSTGNIQAIQRENGVCLLFTYGIQSNEKKDTKAVISFDVNTLACVDFEYSFFSETNEIDSGNINLPYGFSVGAPCEYELRAQLISNTNYYKICLYQNRVGEKLILPGYLDGEKVITIEDSLFADSDNIKYVYGNLIEHIGESSFAGCSNLESIYLGDNLKAISESAFSGCKNLKDIHIPASTKRIGKNAFANCVSIERITFEDTYNWIANGVPIYLEDPVANASKLTDEYLNYDIFKSSKSSPSRPQWPAW